MARFFIDRPIFAWVIAIVIMLAGGLAITSLPVSMYPDVAPPNVQIRAHYPGASAQVVEESVTQVIEQNMKGLDGLLYFSSNSSSNGRVTISLTFQTGTDPDTAQVQVQNQLQLAMPRLPQEVQRQGVNVAKSTTNFLRVVGFVSEDGSMSQADISDYVAANLVDPLSRVTGVDNIQVFGSQYAMRIWLDPNKLDTYRLSIPEIIEAIQAQNAQIAVGQLGAAPAMPGQQLNATINAQDRLQTPEQFRDIIIRSHTDGSELTLGDIARVELGQESYEFIARNNRMPSAGLGISLATGANALETAAALDAAVAELEPYFPQGLKAVVPFDTTPFVKISINNVIKTLIEAIILVFAVMFLFLQNFRATLIPTIAVPVVLLGTFGILAALGFSINMLTMFAMVLAIGLLVDDAIVVVENVERLMSEEGLSPREATAKSMGQVTSALIGFALVLSALFGPMAFFAGSTGIIYRQFSVTVVSSMLLSVLVALILTPVLCANILKPVAKGHDVAEGANRLLRPLFLGFDRGFYWFRDRFVGLVSVGLNRPLRFTLVYLLIVGGLVVIFRQMPTSYLPDEDQGILLTQIILPTGSTLEQTNAVAEEVKDYFLDNEPEAVESCMVITGAGFSGRAQNNSMVFVKLRDWNLRDRDDLRAKAVGARASMRFAPKRDAIVVAFPPPAIAELGTAQGFDFQLVDRGGADHDELIQARNQLLGMASQDPRLASV